MLSLDAIFFEYELWARWLRLHWFFFPRLLFLELTRSEDGASDLLEGVATCVVSPEESLVVLMVRKGFLDDLLWLMVLYWLSRACRQLELFWGRISPFLVCTGSYWLPLTATFLLLVGREAAVVSPELSLNLFLSGRLLDAAVIGGDRNCLLGLKEVLAVPKVYLYHARS